MAEITIERTEQANQLLPLARLISRIGADRVAYVAASVLPRQPMVVGYWPGLAPVVLFRDDLSPTELAAAAADALRRIDAHHLCDVTS